MEQMIVAMACFSELLYEYHMQHTGWYGWDAEKHLANDAIDSLEDIYFNNNDDLYKYAKYDNLYNQGVRIARATKRYNSN